MMPKPYLDEVWRKEVEPLQPAGINQPPKTKEKGYDPNRPRRRPKKRPGDENPDLKDK